MGFEQAAIPVQQEAEYRELQAAVDRCFDASHVERFLKVLKAKGVPIRDFESVLAKGLLAGVDRELGKSARGLYAALPVSDQAQMREHYLVRLEQVADELRRKFHSIYRTY